MSACPEHLSYHRGCKGCDARTMTPRGETPAAAPTIVVFDRVPFSASVTPEQAAAYCRARLAGWEEITEGFEGEPPCMRRFTSPDDGRRVHVPMRVPDPNDPRGDWSDYPQRVAELVDALVALGCGEKPSDVLRGMAEVRL